MLSRYEALRTVIDLLTDQLVIHCNGMIGRESCDIQDRRENFYMIGSMGMAPSIGLGVALSRPDRQVVVLDGDGNILMNMESLAMVGALRPRNYLHIVFDNGVYGSTGNQPTLSDRVHIEEVARAAGYRETQRIQEKEELIEWTRKYLVEEGPTLLLVRVKVDSLQAREKIGRVSHPPEEITRRFMSALSPQK